MRAAVMEGIRRPLVVRNMPDPTPQANGALIRVEANGICRSDWHLWTGDWTWVGMQLPMPHVLGHEFCGVVEEVGRDVSRVKKGDRVLVPFSQGEGTCEWCRSGHHNVCDTPLTPGVAYWGGFGRYVALPFADVNLVPLAESISFVDAASMGCRYMTSFHGIVDQAQVRAGEWVAVHGCGGIGLSAVQIATALGANVIGVDVSDEKLKLAQQLGAVATVNASKDEPIGAVTELTGGGAHVSVDALGIAATCRNSVGCLRKRGRHLQIGLTTSAEKGEIALPIDLIVLKEVSIIGSLGMPAPRFPAMLKMVEAGKLAPGKLVSKTIPLEEAGGVLESMDRFATVGVTVINKY
ncbi:MAG TPA: zinc-dependent alcohol dehydrogenase family protein [Candidatus Kryptonia bacterium]|nr:zinc-dependent alcohol dehydrogenase family protein [Candidatus Kryptonia bacterium]